MKTGLGNTRRWWGSLEGGLRQYWWVVASCVVGLALLAFVYSSLQTAKYEGVSKVVVKNFQNLSAQLDGSSGSFQDPNRVVATQAGLVKVPQVLRDTLTRAGLSPTDIKLLNQATSVDTQVNSDIITIKVVWDNRETATKLASALAASFVAYRAELDTSALVSAEKDLQTQISSLRAGGSDQTFLQQLTRTQLDLRSRILLGSRNSEVVETDEQADQISPRPLKSAGLAGLAGLLIAVGAIAVLQLSDRRIRTPDEASAILQCPLLASIPSRGRGAANDESVAMLENPSSRESEAYRLLAASLDLTNVGGGSRVIMVTSAASGDGKTTCTANSGVASARAGRLVALCDFDLRKPGLSQLFRLRSQVGLTNVLTTSVSADDALENIDLAGADEAPGLTTNPNNGLLSVFGSGPLPPNPGDFVVAPGVTKLFDTLRDSFDLVLVDTPPWLVVGDALALSKNVDGVILVVKSGATRKAGLMRLRQGLEDARTPLLGFVMVNWRPGGAESYGDYGYYYGEAPAAGQTPAIPASVEPSETR